MAKNSGFNITGEKEINEAFKKFLKEMKKALRKNMRKGMKKLKDKVVELFPKDTGQTAKQFKVKAGKGRKPGDIKIDVRSNDDNYVEKFIEFGTENADGTERIAAQAPMRRAFDAEGQPALDETLKLTRADAGALLKQNKIGE